MNGYTAVKAALFNSKPSCYFTKAAHFHSTSVLDRRRRNYWDTKNNYYSKRFRKLHAKEHLLRNVSSYADFLFQSWRDECDEDDPTLSKGPSWFKRPHSGKDFRKGSGNRGSPAWDRRGFRICEDEDDYIDTETIFRSSFGGNPFYYWSFVNEEKTQWRSSSRFSKNSWNWRHRIEEEYEYEYEYEFDSESLESDFSSHRLALGLSASGPLKLQEVKNAYRACALKWHPDRHLGSSKAVAEEKFKLCSAAYQSLCDKLAVE